MSDCGGRGFAPSAYERTSDTKIKGGEHDYEHPKSQRRRFGL